jgi:type II secretory pathway pseudopilin PulG
MTLIEVVAAALLLALIVGAVALQFVGGSNNSLASQRQSALLQVADQQIEKIRQAVKTNQYGFAALTMQQAPVGTTGNTLPSQPAVHTNPNDFVDSCGGYQIQKNYNNTSEGLETVPQWTGCPAGVEPFSVWSAASGIPQSASLIGPPGSVPVGSGTANVYAYVTNTNLGCADLSGSGGTANCTGDARRVVVAVCYASSNGTCQGRPYDASPTTPVFVTTMFANPVPSNQPNGRSGVFLGVQLG